MFPLDFCHLLLCLGQTGRFLRLIIYTSLTFLTLQSFMQIPFAYIPPYGKSKFVTLVRITKCPVSVMLHHVKQKNGFDDNVSFNS